MQNGALRNVAELPPDTRRAMESILGRSLQEDEAISINVYKRAPTGQAREKATQRLLERIDKTASELRACRKKRLKLRSMRRATIYATILNENHARYGHSCSDHHESDWPCPGIA